MSNDIKVHHSSQILATLQHERVNCVRWLTTTLLARKNIILRLGNKHVRTSKLAVCSHRLRMASYTNKQLCKRIMP